MAQHLYIAGADRICDYQRGTLQIKQALTYEIDTCQFQVKGTKPVQGDEVIYEDDSLGRLFGGIIETVELAHDYFRHASQNWAVNCNDYTDLLDRRLVVESYEDMAADAIFKDIAAKYCADFTVAGVNAGAPIVESIAFNYIVPSECFKQLCDYTGWEWQPDYYKDLQFFNAGESMLPAPMTLSPGGSFVFGKHSIDQQDLRNRVYVIGGTMLSDFQPPVEWKADGVSRQWTLPWGPHKVSFEVGAVPQTVGIENIDDETAFDYMLNFSEKYIRAGSSTSTIAAGTTLSLTAKQDIDVITIVEDLESQAAIAAAQGGDGVYEHVITDTSLTTIEAAEAAGNSDLANHANPIVSGNFETGIPGWLPGQIVNINLPDRGITGTYLVQKVEISKRPGFWTFNVQYGGRLIGIADFLKALVSSQQQTAVATEILHKFSYGADTTKITDVLEDTPRTPPWVCGDADAISGFVLCWRSQIWVLYDNVENINMDSADYVFEARNEFDYFLLGESR